MPLATWKSYLTGRLANWKTPWDLEDRKDRSMTDMSSVPDC